MSSIQTLAETHGRDANALCRVCGETLKPQQIRCRTCGSPTRSPIPSPLDSTWVDVLFATMGGITALAICIPMTFWLGEEIWKPPSSGGFPVDMAMAISLFNGWLIGIPMVVTILRWRNRIQDDDAHHSLAIRDYWQIQALCLIPPGIILSAALALYLIWIWS